MREVNYSGLRAVFLEEVLLSLDLDMCIDASKTVKNIQVQGIA